MFAGYGHNGVPAVPPPSRATYGNEPTSCARAYTLYCTIRTDAPREDLHVLVHCTSTAPRAQPRPTTPRKLSQGANPSINSESNSVGVRRCHMQSDRQ